MVSGVHNSNVAKIHERFTFDSRGAIFVEKLIVYTPVLLLFFLGFQLAELASAHLVVRRATSAAARAAAVVLPDDPAFYDGIEAHKFEGARKDDIYLATAMILAAAPQIDGNFEVDVSEPPIKEFGPLHVTVNATFHCGGLGILCGPDGDLPIRATTRQAYHLAEYEYEALTGIALGALGRGAESPSQYGKTSQAVTSRANGTPSTPRTQTNTNALLTEISKRCGCRNSANRHAMAGCISDTAADVRSRTLAHEFTIRAASAPNISDALLERIKAFVTTSIPGPISQAALLEWLLETPTTDLAEILTIIQTTVDFAGAEMKRRSGGNVMPDATIFRVDAREPESSGWAGLPYMTPHLRHPDYVDPWLHYRLGSAGTSTYVSASGPGQRCEEPNAKLGVSESFGATPVICLDHDTQRGLVEVPCTSNSLFKLKKNVQYKAVNHAVYVPINHPLPQEHEVLALAVQPENYRILFYTEFKDRGSKQFSMSATRYVPIVYR